MKLGTMLKASCLSAALVAGAGALVAEPLTLNAAVGLPPSNSTVTAYKSFAEYVAENSDIDIKVFSLSLLSMAETGPGLRDGLADLGFVLPVYYPAEYAESNLVANLSMLSTAGKQVDSPGAAMAGAMTEYLLNCEDCIAEYTAENQVYLGSVSSASYVLLCNKPIATVADLKGTKLRSGSPNFSRWAEQFDAIAVSMSANDQYEALGQGVIDCTMAAISELTNNSLADVTKFVTLGVPGGVFSGAATANFNKDVWQGLTLEQRTVILKGMARMQSEMTLGYYALAEKDRAAAADMGVELIQPSQEMIDRTNAFVMGDIKIIEAQFASDYGIENAGEKITKITALVEKWKGLVDGKANDPAALEQVYWDEIFSKLDPATFGMD